MVQFSEPGYALLADKPNLQQAFAKPVSEVQDTQWMTIINWTKMNKLTT